MQTEKFWQHWQVKEEPFRAEEARDDPVFMRLVSTNITHPDFQKVFGQPDRPSAAVVFGEKGSGKTALRLLMERTFAEHNKAHPDRRAWVVRYDDWNPVLDRFAHAVDASNPDAVQTLEKFRLADHQDAILSLSVTRLVDTALGERRNQVPLEHVQKRLRQMSHGKRADLATLAALYDQPRAGHVVPRWRRLRRLLGLGSVRKATVAKWGGIAALLIALVLWLVQRFTTGDAEAADAEAATLDPQGMLALAAVAALLGIGLIGYWAAGAFRIWSLARKIRPELRTVERHRGDLQHTLAGLPATDLEAQPLPLPGAEDSRYQLTARLLDLLRELGYTGLVVLVDRVDEPAAVNGDPQKMRAIIWPMLNNKFLQQDGVGVKLLLPIELRHLLRREDELFFQRARLDKQHMIERLVWSGTTLYDLCNQRLQACREESAEQPITLTDLFDDEVTRQDVIDALDQMLQPRDAFKFLYQVIQEHCSNVPDDAPAYRVPRLTLQNIRRLQSQRVQELQRGLSPA